MADNGIMLLPANGSVVSNLDEEMSAAERELAEDAQWKRIQQNTFTRWANEHLKTVNKNIGNLETDLGDGLRLITLIEVLSGQKLPKHNKRPNFRSQKLENVSLALKFLADEGIRIVNIDSSDIVDCKLKLILGLIWTLILHYSISMPMWDGEEILQNGDKGPGTPKQRLLHWIQSKLPDLPISNFTTDWNDGRAVGALVDAVAPGLCPDWQDWNPNDALENAKEAMDLADNWLDVKQLIKPEELVSPNMDELSMMTYLSQYPNAKLKPNAPLRPRTNPNRVRAYGPGIQPTGPIAGAPAVFTVETFSAGKGNVNVIVTNPKGKLEPVDVKFNNDRNMTFTVTYTPKLEGNHKVTVKFADKEIPKSPYNVSVEGHVGDPTKVIASGPGLLPEGNTINKPTYFDISTKDAGHGVPEVVIVDAAGHNNSAPIKLKQTSTDSWRCDYIASTLGLHSINVFFGGLPIPSSPFGVKISPTCDAKKVKAYGRGLQPTGVRVKDEADFRICTEGAGEGKPEIQIIGPGGVKESFRLTEDSKHNYSVVYHPQKEGRYVIMITYGGTEIGKSPFEVNVGPYKETQIRAYGPGLVGGVVAYPALFTVETNGETGALGFSIEGPSQAKIDCHDNGDGSADVRYYPTAPGEYAVHILCDSEDIPKSPYVAQILPNTDYFPDKVEVQGKGVSKTGVIKGKPTEFTVDTRKAGSAPLDIQILDSNCNNVDVNIKDNKNGVYTCSYLPRSGSRHTVQVNYGGVAVPKSPFRISVAQPLDASKVEVFGPGVEKDVKSNTPTHFNVDCKEAGTGNLEVSLKNNKGVKLPTQIIENEDNTYTVEYTAPTPGPHTLNVTYGGVPIPQSPIHVPVQPHVDVSKVKVDGLEPTAIINSLQQFRVLTLGAGKADLAVAITSPSGSKIRAHIIPTHEGYLVNFTPTELGEYLMGISFGGEPVLPTPVRIMSSYGADPQKVKATGPGLENGIVDRPAEFMIDTRGAGHGSLGVTVEGPCEASINCRDNGDGTCSVYYLPTEIGDYSINITFNDEHIPNSPFQAIIYPAADLSKMKIFGNGIQPYGVYVDSPTDFTIDSRAVSSSAPSKINCKISNPSGKLTESHVFPQADGTFKINYTPFEEGKHTIDITYDGLPIPGSPYTINVVAGCDAKKCKAFGPGLEKGLIDKPNTFTVETKGAGTGGLGLAIEGPSEAKMTCKDNRDGSCSVEYIPTEPGDYDVSIQFANQHIPGSPFKVPVGSIVDAKQVKAFGPGLTPSDVRENVPVTFRVDTTKAGKAPLDVTIQSDGVPLPEKPTIRDNKDGTYDVTYVPTKEGANLSANIKYDNKPIPKSPFNFKVKPKVEPEKVKVDGPGINGPGVPASLPTDFTIDTTQAGFGDLEVKVVGPDGYPRKVSIADKDDGIFKGTFTPDDCGRYKIITKYGGKEISPVPTALQAVATGNAEKCKITDGIKKSVPVSEEQQIKINASQAGKGKVTGRVRSTSGSDVKTTVKETPDGSYDVSFKPEKEGDYTLNLKYGGQTIPEGFYTFSVEDSQFVKSESYSVSSSTSSVQKQEKYQKYQNQSVSETQFRPVELNCIPLPTTGGQVTGKPSDNFMN